MISVSSLQALAQMVFIKYGAEKVITGMDARMSEIYFGKYILDKKDKIMVLIDKETLVSAQEVKNSTLGLESDWFYAGSAFQKEAVVFPSAEAIIPVAVYYWQQNKTFLPEKALPVYLRDKITF